MNLIFFQKIITMLVFVASTSLWAQIERNFVPANPPHTQNIRGNAVLIGNRSIKPRPGPYGRVGQTPLLNVQQRRTNHGPVNGVGVGNHPYDQTKVQWKFDYKHQPHIPVNEAGYNSSLFGEKGNNSSKATLTIPANSRIVWAGLYWTGMLRTPLSTPKGVNTGDIVEARKWVKFKHSSDTNYQTIRAYDQDPSMIDPLRNAMGNPTYVPEHTNSIFFTDRVETYVGFADVTEYVKQYGVGEYTVADVKADLYYEGGNYTNASNGVTKHYDKDFDPFLAVYGQVPESIGPYLEYNFGAGWSLAVIYEDETLPSRLIKLYNGKAAVSPLNPAKPGEDNTTVELNVFQNNFLTPEAGAINPVLYGMASGGDWNNNVGTGDRMEILNSQTNTWEKVYANVGNSPTGAIVPNKEFFSGEVIPSGNSVYSNSTANNTGKHSAFDMVMAYPDNTGKQYFTNSQTSSNLRFVVNDDYVNLFMVGASFESYFPIPHATIERINSSSFTTASFSVKLYNKGDEPLKNTILYIPLPHPIQSRNFNTGGLGTATFVDATSIPADTQTNSDTSRGYNTPEISTPYGYIKWEINTSVPNDAVGQPFTRKGELTFEVDLITTNCPSNPDFKLGGTIRAIGEKSQLRTQGTHSILEANSPDNGRLQTATAKNAQATLLCDTDKDGIPDLTDEDDDNDGIPDVQECDSNLLKNGVGEFYKKNHTRNDVVDFAAMGWQVSGTYDSNSPWTNAQPVLHIDNKKTGEIIENSGLLFQREYSTQSSIQRNIDFGTITQPPLVVLKGFSYSRKQTAAPPLRVEFTISYNGVDYLRIHTSNRIVQPLNGASVVNGVTEITNPTQTNRFEHLQDIYLQLPATISTTGDFKMSIQSGPVMDGDDISIQEVQILTHCNTDTDGDGIPDYLDTDSDNDGCPDALEGSDANLKTNDVQEGRITGNVSPQGIPTKVNGGQQKGSAQVASQEIKTDLPATISICEGESNEAKSVVFAVETSVFKDENGVRVPDYDQGSFVETLGKWEEKIAGGTWQDFTGDANVSTEKSYNNTTGLTEFKLKFTNVPFSKNGMEYRLSVWTGNKKCLQETSIKLEVNKKPAEITLRGTREICASTQDNTISFADFVQVEAGHSLVWYADNNATTSAETTTLSYNTKTPTAGKSYWVAYKNDTTSCIGARKEVKLVVNALPAKPSVGTTQPSCGVETGKVKLTNLPSGNWTIIYGTTEVTGTGDSVEISNLAPSTYKFKVKNASGCISEETEEIEIKAYVDTEKPVVTAPAEDLKLDCEDKDFETKVQNWLATAGITDNCDTNPTKANDYAAKKAAITNLCETGEIEITFTGTDKTGNTGTPVTKKIKLISAKDDRGTAISSTSEDVKAKDGNGTTLNVLKNKPDASSTENVDKINGEEATIDNVTITSTETNELKIDTTTGEVIVKQGTPTGTYTIEYIICEKDALGNKTSNCATANVEVKVTAPIQAKNDTFNVTNKGGETENTIFDNNGSETDTLNGSKATIDKTEIKVTEVATPIGNSTLVPEIDTTTGKVKIPAGTPAGTYYIEYNICEKDAAGVSIGNCSEPATVTINVKDAQAKNDTFNVTNKGGETQNTVFDNNGSETDTLNGSKATIDKTEIKVTEVATPIGNSTLVPEINTETGKVKIPAGTPAGTYYIKYKICEKNATTENCSSTPAIVTVNVNGADNDLYNIPPGGGSSVSIIENDIPNGTLNTDIKIVITETPAGTTIPIIDVEIGKVSVPAGTPVGSYTFKYQLCKIVGGLTTTDCTEAVEVTVIVEEQKTCELQFYNGISPDQNDGENDTFVIKGLECYPENTLKIFNRWGVLIYEKQGYDNSFNGYSTGRLTISKNKEEVPRGTYYYVFEYKDQNGNTHRKAGWLYKL